MPAAATSSDRVAINPRDATHEPVCTRETRVCWAEFAASLACLLLGVVFVLAGVANDSSAVGPNAGRPGNAAATAGAKAATYTGVALLLAGTVLMLAFGVHFYLVKRRLDRARLLRFQSLGIRPTSRYSTLPPEPQHRPAAALSVVSASSSFPASAGSVQPTGSGFYNLGFSVDDRPPAPTSGASAATSSSGIGSSPASSVAMSTPRRQAPPHLLLLQPQAEALAAHRSSQI